MALCWLYIFVTLAVPHSAKRPFLSWLSQDMSRRAGKVVEGLSVGGYFNLRHLSDPKTI